MDLLENLICPICKNPLFSAERSFKCENGHSYDLSKSGYINLLSPGKKNNAKAGDSKEMINARALFFSSDCYGKINEYLCSIVKELRPVLTVDAGCGEGYYTHAIAKHASVYSIGFDMSKYGCEHGARLAKREGLSNILYSVSNIFDMPILDGCADAVISMFAPVADREFFRVLKSGGYLIIGAAGRKHLYGLKSAIYDEVYLNEPSAHEYAGFELIRHESLKYQTQVEGNDLINALFMMTPYYHRTTLSDKEKLKALTLVNTDIEVDFFIMRKK